MLKPMKPLNVNNSINRMIGTKPKKDKYSKNGTVYRIACPRCKGTGKDPKYKGDCKLCDGDGTKFVGNSPYINYSDDPIQEWDNTKEKVKTLWKKVFK